MEQSYRTICLMNSVILYIFTESHAVFCFRLYSTLLIPVRGRGDLSLVNRETFLKLRSEFKGLCHGQQCLHLFSDSEA